MFLMNIKLIHEIKLAYLKISIKDQRGVIIQLFQKVCLFCIAVENASLLGLAI